MRHSRLWAKVGAREDVDNNSPRVIYWPDHSADPDMMISLTADEARRLAYKLRVWADRLEDRRKPRARR